MKIISLDQNFLFNFVRGKDERFVTLYQCLKCAVNEGQVLCPMHEGEMSFESSLLPSELESRVLDVAVELSRGFAFWSMSALVGWEFLRVVRPEARPPVLRYVGWMPMSESSERQRNRALRENYARRLNAVKYPPSSYRKQDKFADILRRVRLERSRDISDMLSALASGENPSVDWEVLDEAADVLWYNRVTRSECDQINEAVLSLNWDAFDVLSEHTNLCARLEDSEIRGGRKAADPNDALDLTRVSVGLRQADLVCCDNAIGRLVDSCGSRRVKPLACVVAYPAEMARAQDFLGALQ
jgi:hypothetical protein